MSTQKAPKIRKFEEVLDYGRKGRTAYVADIAIFKAFLKADPHEWGWRELEIVGSAPYRAVRHAMAFGIAVGRA